MILLTISFAGENGTHVNENQTQVKKAEIVKAETLKIVWTVSIIVPFAVSALLATSLYSSEKSTLIIWSVGIMRIGFGYIILGIGVIAAYQIYLIQLN